MTKFPTEDIDVSAPWQVLVRRHGAVVHEELLESFQQAAEVAAEWGDVEDVELEVTDLRGRVEDDDVDAFDEDDYPHA